MKKKKGFGLGISLIAIMLIVCIELKVIMMMTGGKKDTYYGIMKDNTTIEKMISEKSTKVLKKNVKLPSDSDVKVKKGDFVIVYKLADSDKIVKVKKVDHDDVPHGLMMKIHDMGKMHINTNEALILSNIEDIKAAVRRF